MDIDEFLEGTREDAESIRANREWVEAAVARVVECATAEGWAEVTVGQRDKTGTLTRVGIREGVLYYQHGDEVARVLYNPEEDENA